MKVSDSEWNYSRWRATEMWQPKSNQPKYYIERLQRRLGRLEQDIKDRSMRPIANDSRVLRRELFMADMLREQIANAQRARAQINNIDASI